MELRQYICQTFVSLDLVATGGRGNQTQRREMESTKSHVTMSKPDILIFLKNKRKSKEPISLLELEKMAVEHLPRMAKALGSIPSTTKIMD
jgi:hypothetical protein